MRQIYFSILLIFMSLLSFGQTLIKGTVKDKKGSPIPGCNVIIKDSYDGGSTNAEGVYSFETFEEGAQIIVVKYVGFITQEIPVDCNGETKNVDIVIKEDNTQLDPVNIAAGSFEASDEKKAVVLKPLDIVTTAGADGDVFSVLQTLPGTQQVGDQTGIFVRGGSANETTTIIDEMVVRNPFFSAVPDVPQRGRFSPFLFKGTVFSTGGYSAVYGQALSSALILNSQDVQRQDQTGVGILPVGLSLNHNQSWESGNINVSGSYNNLWLYFKMNKQLRNWESVPQGGGGSIVFRQKTSKTGIFKFYGTYSTNKLGISYNRFSDTSQPSYFRLNNQNVYLNSSYKEQLGEKWTFFLGSSYSFNQDDISSDFAFSSNNHLGQLKTIFTRYIMDDRGKIRFGAETHYNDNEATYNGLNGAVTDSYNAGFVEAEIPIFWWWAFRAGGRYEYSTVIDKHNVAPRASMAFRWDENSQVNLAYGNFYQTPENQYLFYQQNLKYQRADHYILNYQFMKNDRIFRVEGYYKIYDNLIESDFMTDSLQPYSNAGYGYARGVDLFFRDQKSIKWMDYWVSYSFLDTRRKYQDFPVEAPPTFTSAHNLSVVTKYWMNKWRMSVSLTYSYASGRPYYNPNVPTDQFLTDRTPDYHNLSLSISKIFDLKGHFAVLFVGLNNLTNRLNVFSYEYNQDGTERVAVGPPQRFNFIVGFFISFNHNKKEEEKDENNEE